MRYLILLYLLFSTEVMAEAYLCTAEAAAGITYSDKGKVKSEVYEVGKLQYVMTNSSGKWVVKEVGIEYPLPLKCESGFFCETEGGNGESFFRTSNGYFEYYRRPLNVNNQKIIQVGIIGGRCTSI